jgi:hypothetical protein
MLGRRLPVVLTVVALTAAACEGASPSDQPPRGSAPKAAAAPAAPSYRAGRSQPVADPIYPHIGNPAIDVLHYALALRWAPSKATLSGTATLTIMALRDTDQIRLDFARPLHPDNVTVDGKKATASHRGHDLIISAGRQLAKDTRVVVAIRYHGRPRPLPGPMVRKDITTVGFTVGPDSSVYSIQEPYGALTWYPVNDHPSDEALYDIAFTVPRGWAGVSSGVLRSTSRSGDRVTYRWHAADPLASYLVALGIDRYRKYTAHGPHGIPVTYWMRGPAARAGPPVVRELGRSAHLAGDLAQRGVRHLRAAAVRGGRAGTPAGPDTGPLASSGWPAAQRPRPTRPVQARPLRLGERLLLAGADAGRDPQADW